MLQLYSVRVRTEGLSFLPQWMVDSAVYGAQGSASETGLFVKNCIFVSGINCGMKLLHDSSSHNTKLKLNPDRVFKLSSPLKMVVSMLLRNLRLHSVTQQEDLS